MGDIVPGQHGYQEIVYDPRWGGARPRGWLPYAAPVIQGVGRAVGRAVVEGAGNVVSAGTRRLADAISGADGSASGEGSGEVPSRASKRARTAAPVTASEASLGTIGLCNPRSGGYLGVELKNIDYHVTGTALTTTAALYDPTTPGCLNSVDQGTAYNERVGVKQCMKSIHLKGAVYRAPKNNLNFEYHQPSTVTVALVLDRQTNGSLMTATDAITNAGAAMGHGFPNTENTDRFKVIWIQQFALNPSHMVFEAATSSYTVSGAKINFDVFRKLDIQVTYGRGAGATYASVKDHSLHVVAFTSTSSATLDHIKYISRVTYTG